MKYLINFLNWTAVEKLSLNYNFITSGGLGDIGGLVMERLGELSLSIWWFIF